MGNVEIQPHHAIDNRHPVDFIEPLQETRSAEAELFMAILFWLLRSELPAHMGARVLVLSVCLGSNSLSWAEIGRRTGISREGIRLMAKELERDFGLRASNARKDSTREACRLARSRVIERNRKQLDI